MNQRLHREAKGFTIVELMIALSVLSVLLMLTTATLIQIGKLYSKGINQAAAQNAARSIANEIAAQLQFTDQAPQPAAVGSTRALCIGRQRYTYVLNQQLGHPARHVLWHDVTKSTTCHAIGNLTTAPTPSDGDTDAGSTRSELMPANMRLTDLTVRNNSNGTYTIKVTVAYGEDDLVHYDGATDTTTCVGDRGTEYCAVSSLTVTVAQRVE